MTILVLADHRDGMLAGTVSRVVTAAQEIGGAIDILVAGRDCGAIAAAAAEIAGVNRVLCADDPRYEHGPAERIADLLVSLAPGYDVLMAPAGSAGKAIMPRAAAMLDVMQVSEIVAVRGPDRFDRRIYAGNAILTVEAQDARKVLTVRASAFVDAGRGPAAPVQALAPLDGPALSSFVSLEASHSDRPDLTTARVVVSGGRALRSKAGFAELILPLADKLGAAVGASRAAVDAGFVGNDVQVGQTGRIVAPDLYIACGISGAIQHLAGMKDSRVIVAINNDAQAPIMQLADFALVADIFEALPELTRKL
ncbi:electron transfer flavoprotein subunit beta [Devosia sp. Root436]|jgi:electron transfer flavoprotein alpha subunit|uniref:electron transfer flavoprotein subunit alpha/FixB family protein n=1 Tax=Devosia sp. Root436 TaxID=1736537 RepID=UPI0006F4F27A|nr:FAD-binding protein [Devosia sp. Root436]KQX38123.1 electron transfer flavoprotein subunit beta [Devosia sp. Root436]